MQGYIRGDLLNVGSTPSGSGNSGSGGSGTSGGSSGGAAVAQVRTYASPYADIRASLAKWHQGYYIKGGHRRGRRKMDKDFLYTE